LLALLAGAIRLALKTRQWPPLPVVCIRAMMACPYEVVRFQS